MTRSLATVTLAAAIGLAATPFAARAAGPAAAPSGSEKCFGIAAKAMNDCAAGAHSCAGQSTMDRDPKSFVYLPKGACGKIAGGKMMAT
jgi:uncharacterized membrane protein